MAERTGALQGRVAIVTGGSSGIGRGIALEYGLEGAHVAVVSRRGPVIQKVVEEIRADGGSAHGIVCDVGDAAQVRQMVAEVVETFGPVDILVNAAQAFSARQSDGPTRYALADFPEDEWDYVFRSGLKGSLYTMQAVFPHMRDRGGRIINFGSEVGQRGGPEFAAYAATKEAIRALSRSGAREWGPLGINVNVINPMVETEQSSWTSDPQRRAEVVASTSLHRVAQPRDAGRVAVFLAGKDSEFITGMTFMVDSGRFLFA